MSKFAWTWAARSLFQKFLDTRKGGAGRGIGIVYVGIQLDGDPIIIAGCLDGLQGSAEIDGALARNQVVMDPAGGDILEVIMPRVTGQPRHAGWQIIAH